MEKVLPFDLGLFFFLKKWSQRQLFESVHSVFFLLTCIQFIQKERPTQHSEAACCCIFSLGKSPRSSSSWSISLLSLLILLCGVTIWQTVFVFFSGSWDFSIHDGWWDESLDLKAIEKVTLSLTKSKRKHYIKYFLGF